VLARLVLTSLLVVSAVSCSTPGSTLSFGECPSSIKGTRMHRGLECTKVEVPLDYADDSGPQLTIAVSRLRASGPADRRRGVLLVNPGGPGGPGLEYAALKGGSLPQAVREAFDVIGFDPRGVGRSSPIDCGSMGGLFDHPGPDPLQVDRPAQLRKMARDCAIAAGRTLPHISTANTARDMDRIRAALGVPKLNFLGVSYGSWLGAEYARLFAHRVDTMVLDSVVGTGSWYGFDIRQATAMLAQRNIFFTWLAAHHNEFRLGGTADEVRAAYTQVQQRLPIDGFGPAEFDRVVYRALGRTKSWRPLGIGLRKFLIEGNPDGLMPKKPFGSPNDRNGEAVNRAVQCADIPNTVTSEVIARDRTWLRYIDPSPVLTGMEADVCAYWRRPGHSTTGTGVAVLLVAADHDPVTPIDGARTAQQALPGSRLVTEIGGYSHGVFASQHDRCVDDTVADYLLNATLPHEDRNCPGPGLPD
jgi:pimeloyl-ACP methyl ester carboxylesterase